jgi:hypothetical protein
MQHQLREFGEKRGISLSTLSWWRRVFRHAGDEEGNGAAARAVKNSMKRSLVWAPAAAIAAGSASMPTRMSAGGVATTSSAVKNYGFLWLFRHGSAASSPSPFIYCLTQNAGRRVIRPRSARFDSNVAAYRTGYSSRPSQSTCTVPCPGRRT